MSQPLPALMSDADVKYDTIDQHQEIATLPSDNKVYGSGQGVLRSAFIDSPKWPLVRQFWRLYLTGCAVSLGGMYAGYCLAAVGAVVANPGK